MIDTIIFDFGDVFINTDKNATVTALKKLGLQNWGEEIEELKINFERGKLNEVQFMIGLKKLIPNASIEELRAAWFAVLKDFPLKRLEFLQHLSHKYRLFLLSNCDEILIPKFEHLVGATFSREFYQCFEKVYFSYEMKMRKPEPELFNYIINSNNLSLKRTLFIDNDKKNTDLAKSLGMEVWNLEIEKEDVVQLFEKNLLVKEIY